ncbi:hypothetical protein [Brevundimonas diminuta]
MISRIWRAAFAVGNLRLWSIILGAFPLTAFAAGIGIKNGVGS